MTRLNHISIPLAYQLILHMDATPPFIAILMENAHATDLRELMSMGKIGGLSTSENHIADIALQVGWGS